MGSAIITAAGSVPEIVILVAVLVWTTPLLWLFGWIGDARFRIFWSCAALGAGYGAALGSICGAALWLHAAQEPLWGVIWGLILGASLGMFGGGVAGFFGSIQAGCGRWCLVGVLGSTVPSACFWIVSGVGASFSEGNGRKAMLLQGLVVSAAFLLVGAFLGWALDWALQHAGRSSVPGIQRLASIIREANPSEGAL
jgi:hypothetical protein